MTGLGIPPNELVNRAVAALDSLDDSYPALAFWKSPSGEMGPDISNEELRQGLLDGTVDPQGILRSIALLNYVSSDKFADEYAQHVRSEFQVIPGGTDA